MKTVTKNLFRVLFLMMISMSLLVTTGCEDDDDDSGVDGMVGTWVLSKAEVFSVDVMSTYGIAANIVVSADNTFSGTFTFPDPTTMAPITTMAININITLKLFKICIIKALLSPIK